MHIATRSHAGERLTGHLRDAAWMDGAGRAANRFAIVDSVEFGGAAVLIVAPDNDPTRWYSVPLGTDGQILDAGTVFDGPVIDAMRRGLRVPTRRGGAVCFRGDPPPFDGPIELAHGWSSNALSGVRLGGVSHVHKRYRVLSTGVHEPETLRRMRGTACLPEYAGDYAYLSPAGDRYPMGLAYRFADGEPLEEQLRANLRKLWATPGRIGAALVAEHVRELAAVLTAVGALIGRLHRALVATIAPATTYAVEPCAARARRLLRAVAADLLADGDHPAAVRESIAETLSRAVSAVPAMLAACPPPPGTGGICHGDLHLSHLLCQATPDGSWEVRAIDISSPAIDPGDPEYAQQSPWQDLVAVNRGLEALAAHEAAVESARVLGVPRREACRAAVHDAVSPAAGRIPGRGTRVRLFGAAEAWSRVALRLVIEGYRVHAPVSVRHPMWRVLYLSRMLHELAYNYAHRRAYQVDVDLRYAAGLRLPAGARR